MEFEQEVEHDEVEADTIDSKVVEEMEPTHKKSKAQVKGKKRNFIRSGGKEKWVSCNHPD